MLCLPLAAFYFFFFFFFFTYTRCRESCHACVGFITQVNYCFAKRPGISCTDDKLSTSGMTYIDFFFLFAADDSHPSTFLFTGSSSSRSTHPPPPNLFTSRQVGSGQGEPWLIVLFTPGHTSRLCRLVPPVGARAHRPRCKPLENEYMKQQSSSSK